LFAVIKRGQMYSSDELQKLLQEVSTY